MDKILFVLILDQVRLFWLWTFFWKGILLIRGPSFLSSKIYFSQVITLLGDQTESSLNHVSLVEYRKVKGDAEIHTNNSNSVSSSGKTFQVSDVSQSCSCR